ncbi:MAG: YbhN family protein [Ilumatobacteraceae bacterium]
MGSDVVASTLPGGHDRDGDGDDGAGDPAGGQRRWWRSRILQIALSLAIVALIFGFLLPKLADYGDVWDTVGDLSWPRVVILAGVTFGNLLSYLPLLTAVVPGLRLREAAVSNFASTAVSNTLPGGAALGIGVTVTIQRSFGIGAADIALGAVISGLWNNFAKLSLPVVAMGLLALSDDVNNGLAAAAVVGLVVLALCVVGFGLLLRSERLARRVGAGVGRVAAGYSRLLGTRPRRDVSAAAVRFRDKVIGLLKGRAIRITLATVASHLSLYVVLLVAIRVVGVSNGDVSWTKVLAAFAFVRLLSAVPVTPGGIGVVELGLTAALGSGLDDPTNNRVAAAVLLYRALTWFVPIPLGTAAWLLWRSNRSWRHTVAERERIRDHVTAA